MNKIVAVSLSVGLLAFATSGHAATMTVTSPQGTFTNPTTVNAAGPGAGYDTWFANNVRSGGSAGITNAFPDNGNGSIQFGLPNGSNAKADFEYYFSAPNQFLLSSLTQLSYDAYRSSASTAAVRYDPALRLYVSDGQHTGYLVFEPIYNGQSVSPLNQFTSYDVKSDYFWSTGSLPDAAAVYNRTLADWVNLLPNLKVLGLSTGVGSGWDGTFDGGVDNITYATAANGPTTFNFETAAATAVPEPASMAVLGFGLLGLARARARRRA